MKKGRSYEDFQNYLTLNQLDSWLEMDTVMGRMGGKVLLTFNLSFCNFIFARLLDNKTALEVTKHLYDIKNTLHQADKDFFQLFLVILTNNGREFTIPCSEPKLYLSPGLDGFNSEIIAYNLSTTPNLAQVKLMLEQAFTEEHCENIILHSYHGWLYQHDLYHHFIL